MMYAINKRTKEHRVFDVFDETVGFAGSGWAIVHSDPDGWIPWDGGECPLAEGAACQFRDRSGHVGRLSNSVLGCWGEGTAIIAYRPIIDAETKPEPPAWKAGDVCDWAPDGCSHGRHTVVAIHGTMAWVTTGEGGHDFADVCDMYPVRSEEDCAVEKMYKAATGDPLEGNEMDDSDAVSVCRALHRAGYRKTGGEG